MQAPEGWCTKEGLGGAGALGGWLDGAKAWSSRYAKISGPSLLFFKNRDDEEPTATSISDVRGCTLARGTQIPTFLGFADTEEYKIELTRRGRAAEGLHDLRGDDQTTRFCFKEETTRDRWADALENMCAGRLWNVPAHSAPTGHGTQVDWRGIRMPTVTRTAPRIAQMFALPRTAQGFGMKLSAEGTVLSFTDGGGAEPAGVPLGGKVVQVNGVPVRSLKGIAVQLKACATQPSVEFFVLLRGEDSETVKLMFDMLDLDGDGRLSHMEYANFVRHTEGTKVLDETRWGADTRALACSHDGLDFPAFVRLFADTRFKHYGRAAEVKEKLLWQPVQLKWMYEDGALVDQAWAKWVAKKDPLARQWTQGDASQTAASLVAAERDRMVLIRVLMSQGLQRGRLLNQTGLFSSSNWFVLREGVHVGAYDLCVFSSEDSNSDPEEAIQLTASNCATAGGPGEFTVWGYDRNWSKKTWSLKAETVEDQQAWLAAINGLQFGTLVRTTSRSIAQVNADAALAWVEEHYQGEQLQRLLQAIDSSMGQGRFELAGGLLRTLGNVSTATPVLAKAKEQYEAKKLVVQAPLISLLQEASRLLDEEYKRPIDASSHDTCITVRQLGGKLSATRSIDRALGENLVGAGRAAQVSMGHDLKAKIQAHMSQLLMAASGLPDTDTYTKVSLLKRAEHVASLHPEHFPEGSNDPAAEIDGVWGQISASVVKLYEECLVLTAGYGGPPGGGLTRSQSSKVEDGVGLLARKMESLNEYRTAFDAEEGVPSEPEPEPDGLSTEQAEVTSAVNKALELYTLVSAQMSQLGDRLSGLCVQLDQPVVLTTQEGCDAFARTVLTLSYYAQQCDHFATGRFTKTLESQMEQANKTVEHLLQQFDGAVRGGDPATVDKVMDTLEHIEASVPLLAATINQKMPGLQEQMAGQMHNLERKATDLYQCGNLIGLSQFLKELQTSPSLAVQFSQVQAQVTKKLERAHTLAVKCLEQNVTSEHCDILAECMRSLDNAHILEDVIDSGVWRLGLRARIQDVCSNLRDEAVANAKVSCHRCTSTLLTS